MTWLHALCLFLLSLCYGLLVALRGTGNSWHREHQNWQNAARLGVAPSSNTLAFRMHWIWCVLPLLTAAALVWYWKQ